MFLRYFVLNVVCIIIVIGSGRKCPRRPHYTLLIYIYIYIYIYDIYDIYILSSDRFGLEFGKTLLEVSYSHILSVHSVHNFYQDVRKIMNLNPYSMHLCQRGVLCRYLIPLI